MMRSGSAMLMFLLTGATAFACAAAPLSTGFSDPAATKAIDEFRLPSWGYKTLILGFSFSGKGEDHEFRAERYGDFDLNLGFRPSFSRYHESDEAVTAVSIDLGVGWLASGGDLHYVDGWEETEDRRTAVEARVDTRWQQYLRPKFFLTAFANGLGNHRVEYTEWRSDDENTKSHRRTTNFYDTYLGVGFGLGRIRNVTPVIRALRLSERLSILGDMPALGEHEIQSIADRFAMRSGYLNVYDRSAKYFWDDVFAGIEGLGELSGFEAYYLSEILVEKVGERFEGWEATAGVEISDQEYSPYERTLLSGVVRARCYRNLTLTNQVKSEHSVALGRRIDASYPGVYEGSAGIVAGHLWVVADRLIWEQEISASLYFTRVEEMPGGGERWQTDQRYDISSELTFFIEDRLALTSAVRVLISREDRVGSGVWYIRQHRWLRFDLALTYYIDRHLGY